MTDLHAVFEAGRVMRWHTNPRVVDTNDRNDGHSARVARIILSLWPDATLQTLRAALKHDDGEKSVADVSGNIKEANPSLAAMVGVLEMQARIDMWSFEENTLDREAAQLRLADRLDAYQWVKYYRPEHLREQDWPQRAQWLLHEASRLGVREQVARVVKLTGQEGRA